MRSGWSLLVTTAVLALVAIGASSCSSSSTGSGTSTDRASQDGIETFLTELIRNREWERNGPAYDALVPQQQALFSKATFVDCGSIDSNMSNISLEILDVYEEPIRIDGTSDEVESTAVTVTLRYTVGGRLATDTTTFHLVDVEGEWRWITTEDQIERCTSATSSTAEELDQVCQRALDEYGRGLTAAVRRMSTMPAESLSRDDVGDAFYDLGYSVGEACAFYDPGVIQSELILSAATLLEDNSYNVREIASSSIEGICADLEYDLTPGARAVCAP